MALLNKNKRFAFKILYILAATLLPVIAHTQITVPAEHIRFSVIKTAESSGSLEAMVVDGGSWFTVRRLVHVAVLVRHPKGDFLWDSGIGREIDDQMSVFNFFEKQLFSINNAQPARDQLEQLSYPVNSLMAVIPSHMHWDHVSGLEDFNGIPVWVQENSYAEAITSEPPGFVLSQYDSPNIMWHDLKLTDTVYKGFERSLDIYGDGSAILVDLSGHSHGHLGLFVTLDSGQQFFFIGDTTWAVKGIHENRSRPWITEALVGVDSDFEQNAQVINKIHQLVKNDMAIIVVPAHDELQLKHLPIFPNFTQ